MKVGDYVRNKYGIAKVIDIKNNNGIDILVFDKDICFLVNKETKEIKDDKLFNQLAIIEDIDINKIKSSPNIIDLIEVGDYVNGSEVCKIYDNNHLDNPEKEVFCMGKDGFEGELIYTNDNIKSIVTKEQFEAMQYKVGE